MFQTILQMTVRSWGKVAGFCGPPHWILVAIRYHVKMFTVGSILKAAKSRKKTKVTAMHDTDLAINDFQCDFLHKRRGFSHPPIACKIAVALAELSSPNQSLRCRGIRSIPWQGLYLAQVESLDTLAKFGSCGTAATVSGF